MKACETFHVAPFNHNCAQAIAHKWAHLYDRKDIVAGLARCGGGMAPGGMCGALYAATLACPEEKDRMVEEFGRRCGGTRCRELKGQKITPCTTCVDTADKILDDLMGRP